MKGETNATQSKQSDDGQAVNCLSTECEVP